MTEDERVNIPGYIDHSFLGPERGLEEFERFCEECLEYKLASACVPPFWVKRTVERLGDKVPTSGVIAFPWGLEGTDAKVAAVRQSLADGARGELPEDIV